MAAIEDSLKTKTGGLFEGYSGETGVFDEAMDREGGLRERLSRICPTVTSLTAAGIEAPSRNGRRIIQRTAHHLQCPRRSAGHGAPWQAGPDAAGHRADEWRLLEAGLMQRATLINHPGRLLRPAGLIQRACFPRRWFSPSRISASLPRHAPARRHVSAFLRGRSGALAGRALVGDFRPHADSHRRRLRAGQPAGDVARSA